MFLKRSKNVTIHVLVHVSHEHYRDKHSKMSTQKVCFKRAKMKLNEKSIDITMTATNSSLDKNRFGIHIKLNQKLESVQGS